MPPHLPNITSSSTRSRQRQGRDNGRSHGYERRQRSHSEKKRRQGRHTRQNRHHTVAGEPGKNMYIKSLEDSRSQSMPAIRNVGKMTVERAVTPARKFRVELSGRNTQKGAPFPYRIHVLNLINIFPHRTKCRFTYIWFWREQTNRPGNSVTKKRDSRAAWKAGQNVAEAEKVGKGHDASEHDKPLFRKNDEGTLRVKGEGF